MTFWHKFSWLWALVAGVLYSSGFPFFIGHTQFLLGPTLAMALLWSLWNTHGQNKKNWLHLFLFCLSYCLSGYYWIPHTLNVFGQILFPFDYLLGATFSLIITPQYILFLLLHCWLKKHPRFQKIPWQAQHILLATLLTLLEIYTPQQFPAHVGHAWLSLAPYLGLSPLFGAPLFSFMSFWLAISLAHFCLTKQKDFLMLGSLCLFLIFNFALPLSSTPHGKDQQVSLRIVQANIGNYLKVSSEKGDYQALEQVIDNYYDLSVSRVQEPFDLIIWPETAYPMLLSTKQMKQASAFIPKVIQNTILESDSPLFFGGYDHSYPKPGELESEYNSAFLIDERLQLQDVYHKMKLIPFGESLPFGPLNSFLGRVIKNISFFKAGQKRTLFKTKKNVPFISAICYEILFSRFIRSYLNQVQEPPAFLINLTNDSWYGMTMEPYQHLFLAHWRALEYQIPIVRSTNTGITSILLPDGSESPRLGIYEKSVLDYKLSVGHTQPTLFQRFGHWPFMGIALLLFSLAFFLNRKSQPSL